jgi:hypothetical protein
MFGPDNIHNKTRGTVKGSSFSDEARGPSKLPEGDKDFETVMESGEREEHSGQEWAEMAENAQSATLPGALPAKRIRKGPGTGQSSGFIGTAASSLPQEQKGSLFDLSRNVNASNKIAVRNPMPENIPLEADLVAEAPSEDIQQPSPPDSVTMGAAKPPQPLGRSGVMISVEEPAPVQVQSEVLRVGAERPAGDQQPPRATDVGMAGISPMQAGQAQEASIIAKNRTPTQAKKPTQQAHEAAAAFPTHHSSAMIVNKNAGLQAHPENSISTKSTSSNPIAHPAAASTPSTAPPKSTGKVAQLDTAGTSHITSDKSSEFIAANSRTEAASTRPGVGRDEKLYRGNTVVGESTAQVAPETRTTEASVKTRTTELYADRSDRVIPPQADVLPRGDVQKKREGLEPEISAGIGVSDKMTAAANAPRPASEMPIGQQAMKGVKADTEAVVSMNSQIPDSTTAKTRDAPSGLRSSSTGGESNFTSLPKEAIAGVSADVTASQVRKTAKVDQGQLAASFDEEAPLIDDKNSPVAAAMHPAQNIARKGVGGGNVIGDDKEAADVNLMVSEQAKPLYVTVNAPEVVLPASRVSELQAVIDRLVKSIQQIEIDGKTDTVIEINEAGVLSERGPFAGARITVSEFKSATHQLNITIDNLTPEGKLLVDLPQNRTALLNMLAERGYTVQMMQTTTTMLDSSPILRDAAKQEERGQPESRGGQQQQQRQQQQQQQRPFGDI